MKHEDLLKIASFIQQLHSFSDTLNQVRKTEYPMFNALSAEQRETPKGYAIRDNVMTLTDATNEINQLITLLGDVRQTEE